MQIPYWNKEQTTRQHFYNQTSHPAVYPSASPQHSPVLHPQVRLIIPSPSSLSWGASCQFNTLFLLILHFPLCKHPSLLFVAALEGSEHGGVWNRLMCSQQLTGKRKLHCNNHLFLRKGSTVCSYCRFSFMVPYMVTYVQLCIRNLHLCIDKSKNIL